jgi:hypothetical protein
MPRITTNENSSFSTAEWSELYHLRNWSSRLGKKAIDRPLTPPLDNPKRTKQGLIGRGRKQQTFDQLQSVLFKLPAEIREMIWRHTVGGYHIILPNPKKQNFHPMTQTPIHTGKLALPLSCRRMYVLFPFSSLTR